MPKTDPRVDAYIAKSAPFAQPILRHLRALVHRAAPAITETIKWGIPSLEHEGIVCHMAAFKAHCAFGFWRGGRIEKTGKEDEAMGQFGRITNLTQLPPDTTVVALVQKAAALNLAGENAARPVKRPNFVPMPADFRAALARSGAAGGKPPSTASRRAGSATTSSGSPRRRPRRRAPSDRRRDRVARRGQTLTGSISASRPPSPARNAAAPPSSLAPPPVAGRYGRIHRLPISLPSGGALTLPSETPLVSLAVEQPELAAYPSARESLPPGESRRGLCGPLRLIGGGGWTPCSLRLRFSTSSTSSWGGGVVCHRPRPRTSSTPSAITCSVESTAPPAGSCTYRVQTAAMALAARGFYRHRVRSTRAAARGDRRRRSRPGLHRRRASAEAGALPALEGAGALHQHRSEALSLRALLADFAGPLGRQARPRLPRAQESGAQGCRGRRHARAQSAPGKERIRRRRRASGSSCRRSSTSTCATPPACGPPVIDRRFKTIDFFILFDVDALSSRARRSLRLSDPAGERRGLHLARVGDRFHPERNSVPAGCCR